MGLGIFWVKVRARAQPAGEDYSLAKSASKFHFFYQFLDECGDIVLTHPPRNRAVRPLARLHDLEIGHSAHENGPDPCSSAHLDVMNESPTKKYFHPEPNLDPSAALSNNPGRGFLQSESRLVFLDERIWMMQTIGLSVERRTTL